MLLLILPYVAGGIVAAAILFFGLRWALGSHTRDRQPWLALLDKPAADAAALGGLGAIDGIVSDGNGAYGPIVAPFSGRACIAFVIEIVASEQFMNETTWRRLIVDGGGQFLLAGPDGGTRCMVDLEAGGVIFPTPLLEFASAHGRSTMRTVFSGLMNQAPPHLQQFVHELAPELQQILWRSSRQLIGGKAVYFNERIVVPGDQVVVAGPVRSRETAGGLEVSSTPEHPVSFAFGTVASERARVAKLPVAGELFGLVVVAGIAAFGAGVLTRVVLAP
jgi:hypothetical protein